ncbi:MAG: hypothetical protein JSR78_04285 [Proteobacteria bacterium]|nr:hypothetical protein [Pseudomonadota bacterium]
MTTGDSSARPDRASGSGGLSFSLLRVSDGYEFSVDIQHDNSSFRYGPEFIAQSDPRIANKDIFAIFLLLQNRMMKSLSSTNLASK